MKKVILLAILFFLIFSCKKEDDYTPYFVYRVESQMSDLMVTYMDEFGEYIQEDGSTPLWYIKGYLHDKQELYVTSSDPIATLYILMFNETHECTLVRGYGQLRTIYSH